MLLNLRFLIVLIVSLCCQISAQDTATTVVNWLSTVYLDGVTVTTLNKVDKSVVAATTAAILALPVSSVSFESQKSAVANTDGKSYQIPVNVRVNVLLGDTSFTTASSLYTNSTRLLADGVNVGTFDDLIKSNAAAAPAPHLLDSSAFNTDSTAYTATEKVDKDENLDLTAGGTAIIVICCLVMFFVVIYMAWGATHNTHAAAHGGQNTKGYAITEDEV